MFAKINHKIAQDDLWNIIHRELQEKGLSHHAINSTDDFYEIGIGEIITKVFIIEHIMDNERDKTPQDRQIKKIKFQILMDNIKLNKPVTSGFNSGQEIVLWPNMAHIEDRTYSSNLYVDVSIRAWAYTVDGQEIERKETVKNLRLTSIPTMTGTKLCNTKGKSRETLIQLREDPNDPQAYFIKSGKEWSIDNIESVAFNQPRIFNNYWRNEKQRLEFISKPGDTYQNSKQIIIRLMTNDTLTIEIVTPTLRGIQFPFYMVFRALGWSNDKIIIDHILYKFVGNPTSCKSDDAKVRTLQSDDILGQKMYGIIRKSFEANYDTKNHKFGNSFAMHSQIEVLSFLVKHMPKDTFKDLDFAKPEHLQQAVGSLLRRFDDELLPHVGLTEVSRNEKLMFLGHLINRMLYVHLEVLLPTDRDSQTTKRIHTAGVSIAKTFKTHYNASIVSNIKKQFIKDFKAMPFGNVNLAQTLQISINGADFERLLFQSITSGNQSTLKVNRYRTIVNRLSSQLVDRKNYAKVYSTLRMIISPNSDSSKGSERAHEMRMPHLSGQGFIDLIQSPEGGDKVGLHKQIAISASICSYGSSELLKQILFGNREYLTPLKELHPYNIAIMGKVFVNGDWIGCTKDTSDFIAFYTQQRRELKIHKHTTIEWDDVMNEVYMWVDYGRMIRPVIIVYNNMRDWKKLGLKKPADLKDFEQGIAFTEQIMNDLKAGKLSIDDLLKLQVIEYLTPGEQLRMDVASDFSHLQKHKNDPLRQFTHCDIPEAMLGIASLTPPYGNSNHTPRNAYQTSQYRQTGSYYANNWQHRIDKDTFLQYQVEAPPVYTRINNYVPHNGANTTVAIICYTGYNEEDSYIFNKASGDRLKFMGSWYTYDKVELEKNEQFDMPDIARTTGIKKYANYSKLGKDGIIPIGTIVQKGDIVIGKVKRLPKNIAAEKGVDFSDQSLVYKMEFPSVVHNVVIAKDDEATTFCKVAYKALKPITIGDKFCLRPTVEVLTDSGWKKLRDIDFMDKVATLQGDTIEYRESTGKYKFHHDGEMFSVNNGSIHTFCTLDHKLYCMMEGKSWDLTPAKCTIDKKVVFRQNGETKMEDVDVYTVGKSKFPMDIWLQVVAASVYIGTCVDNKIVFPDNHKIHDALKFLNLKELTIADHNLYDSKLPEGCMRLGKKNSQMLLDYLLAIDQQMVSNTLTVRNYIIANQITQVAFHAGWSAKISIANGNQTVCINKYQNAPVTYCYDPIVQYRGEVMCIEVPGGVFYYRETPYSPPMWTGNSARSGQKGICGIILPQSDMPFSEDGIIPDILMNPHAFPKRMTMGQIFESCIGLLSAQKGAVIDGTMFRRVDMDTVISEMKELGLEPYGRKRLYSGYSGCWIDAEIFQGNVYYQRLQKFVAKSIYSIDIGPTDIITRQPLDGKANQGGLRISELQRDVFFAQGCARFFTEKFFEDSDDFDVYICRCGSRAIVNHNIPLYRCNECGDNADIYAVHSSWSSKQFFMELNAMCIGVRFELEPMVFYT